jgi:hypothetical protein
MTLRSIFFVTAMAFASQGMAEENKAEAAEEQAATPSYCQQLGNTTGFEGTDLEEFVKECEEKRAEDNKQG